MSTLKLRAIADSRTLGLILLAAGVGAALFARATEAKTFLYADLQHFFNFAGVVFTAGHADYYHSVADQSYTYAHLPLFPMLLAPLYRLALAVGWDPILVVKGLIHTFEVGTVALIYLFARQQRLQRVPAVVIALAWLLAPWEFEAAALNGHVTGVAAFFFVAAMLRRRVPWQAGLLMALAVTTRTEFIVAAAALWGWYAGQGRRALGAYTVAAAAVAAVVVGPYLIRDPGALYWGVVGHLQGRGDGLPALRGLVQVATGSFPDALAGPQDWAMPVAVVAAPLLGRLSAGAPQAAFRATLLYALALTLGHGRYFVLPLTAGLLAAARPRQWVWIVPVYLVEFVIPIPRDVRWIMRVAAIIVLFSWPARHLGRLGIRRSRDPAAEVPAL